MFGSFEQSQNINVGTVTLLFIFLLFDVILSEILVFLLKYSIFAINFCIL